ncbi:uncharacterized protein LAJ45_08917 [Morchella importuna]|uniref:uncharacterized protein n=1 Tax=Morchella importuna TaxID=1174673 RepID=UPI001E8D7751|nr:uncharacterized protein LAJ45_08917 [Morchella importuna]KAH8147117.1 hypothetical protein LAJ45_08917 [Morchella importuna]
MENKVDNPTPANPSLAATAATQVVDTHDPAAGVGDAPILAADIITPAAAQSIDEEERGVLGPTSATASVTQEDLYSMDVVTTL